MITRYFSPAHAPSHEEDIVVCERVASAICPVRELVVVPGGETDGRIGQRIAQRHLALKVYDEECLQEVRRRLVKAGASNGTITDFGAVRLVTFKDPDGMEGEVARWTDNKRVLGFEERKRELWSG